MKINKSVLLFLAMIMLFASCRKEIDDIKETPIIPDPIVEIQGSVIGQVQDENLNPIEGAVVKMQGEWVFTDENGLFHLKDQIMPEKGAYVQVEKDDYFTGSRVFYPKLGEENQVIIQLLEKKEVGSFNASQETTIAFEGVEIDFESDGIVHENNEAYQGEVHVVAKYLDPILAATHRQMPGDLTAYDEEGELVALTSMAMIGVELLDDNGNALQLAEGKACTVKIPVPESLKNTAPDVIPLWYFDEEIGRWIEEGEANLIDGIYVGKVAHFTFWNCDIPLPYTTLHIQVNSGETGLVGARVRITDIALNSFREDITNSEGYVGGIVPAGTPLLLEVFNSCGAVTFSDELEPLNEETYMNIVLEGIVFSEVSGTVSSCGSSISENTYVRLEIGNEEVFVGLNEDYSFATTIENCGNATNVRAVAFDPLAGLVSESVEKPFVEEVSFGELSMCDTFLSEQLHYTFGDSTIFATTAGGNIGPYAVNFTKTYINDSNGEPIKVVIEITLLDWITGNALTTVLLYDFINPDNSISIPVPQHGFTASGIGDSYITQSGGEEFFVFSGILTDIEVTDSTLWNPEYNPFTYKYVIKTEE